MNGTLWNEGMKAKPKARLARAMTLGVLAVCASAQAQERVARITATCPPKQGVTFPEATGGAVSVKAGQTLGFVLPAEQHELRWQCGQDARRESAQMPFDQVQVRRAKKSSRMILTLQRGGKPQGAHP